VFVEHCQEFASDAVVDFGGAAKLDGISDGEFQAALDKPNAGFRARHGGMQVIC
jgi:hypothetical protein